MPRKYNMVAAVNYGVNIPVYLLLNIRYLLAHCNNVCVRDRRGHDRMVARFITIYAISAYHH